MDVPIILNVNRTMRGRIATSSMRSKIPPSKVETLILTFVPGNNFLGNQTV